MADADLSYGAAGSARGWSPELLHTLANIFETLAPGEPSLALRRAHLAAEILSAVADPDEIRLLQLAIRSLEWPLAVLGTAGRWGRFGTSSAATREAVLLAWANHPVARFRTTFQAVKRLGLFLAYADPGEDDAGNPSWPRIGYTPPLAAPSPPSPSIAPIDVDRTLDGTLQLEAEIVVVGSGAGGGVVAARLAAQGRDVLVVEAGAYCPEGAMPVLEAQGMQRLYLDQGTTATSDLGITILAGACLGGGTTINWTTSLAPPGWLRHEWEREHGLDGFEGAMTDADIARLRSELDLQAPTTMPAKDQAILDGARALGWEAAPTERNAGPCADCGACGFGCRSGAKRSGLRAHLAAAGARGARFLVRARVDRVTFGPERATGVEGLFLDETRGGRTFSVRARSVVVAAGALRTPLLLQASGISHPQLGRNLHLHPVVAIAARMPGLVEMWTGPTQAARSLEFWQPGLAAADGIGPAHGGFVVESAPPHPGLIASAFPWDGREAAALLMDQVRNVAPLIGIIRDQGGGRVHLTRHRRARIDYRISRPDGDSARRALVEVSRLARAAGAEELFLVAQPVARYAVSGDPRPWRAFLERAAQADIAPNRLSLFSAHQMGSARAGADPVAYPCDPQGRVRADASGALLGGLYVADASLFPSASGVNPMLTVMTLAERVARAILVDS